MQINRFRTQLGANIFRSKYSQGPEDHWDALAERLVDHVCGVGYGFTHPLMSNEDMKQLKQYIKEMKFIPGGRYLYYAGRPNKYFNNCFSGDTKVLTRDGMKPLASIAGSTELVFSPVDGKYYPAEIHRHGEQALNKITFVPVRGKSNVEYVVKATRGHHWPLVDGSDTYDIRVGDVVPANTFSSQESDAGFVHGFVFGDGNEKGQVRLCCAKDRKLLDKLTRVEHTLTYPLYFKDKYTKWKELPDSGRSNEYIAGFIKGWIAADSSETAGNKLCCVNREHLEWFRENAVFAGIVITGELRKQVRNITMGKYEYTDHTIYIQNYSYGEDFEGFKVKSIEHYGVEEVYCPYEPVHNRIVIDHGIDTFNCFLLRAEEDTREEWANLLWRASNCLLTGGGIGVDYSRIRPSGRLLRRTGGLSSGPISLMQMINEVGRGIMQGGSRRSAIYASLNWQHEDIPAFLKAKNWTDTIKTLKEQDFNFPAPLDMTNISLNYDDAWLNSPNRAHDAVFLENCLQAMSTGEPGFSFNFGDKQNETLRNACTEIVSEDDSDVCNLGSINLGNIDSLDEFKDVVCLASKFLVCGTVRADLPYDKIKEVREKNRRLGLGLMGIHEWLLKRGMSYEVTPDLREWLSAYQRESERSANEHCDRLYLSRPVAYRAIAPTGTIGILAGTTTSIEPLFAVAYKRRYLTDGTRWKYEYCIDHTAETLIQQFGIDPERIETAYGMSNDYEKRIKFQADVQDYVDMSISSTINLPAWGSKDNNENFVGSFASVLARYAPRLRGFTCYPDGSRGGQPITEVSYEEAHKHRNIIFEENNECKNGVCGI